MKILKSKDQKAIANNISKLIQIMCYSNMDLESIEKSLDILFDISYAAGGTLNAQVVLHIIEDQRYKENL